VSIFSPDGTSSDHIALIVETVNVESLYVFVRDIVWRWTLPLDWL